MTFLVATVVYPALLVALSLGAGLLLDRVASWHVPGVLLVPVGFAGLVVVSQLTTGLSATAPLTPAALVVVAAAGLVLGWRRLRRAPAVLRAEPWPLVAGLVVYAAACAPVLMSGHATFAAYLLDTTAAIQVAGADYLLAHGLDFTGLAESGYRLQLTSYFGAQYPSGSHTVLGGVGRLVGGDLLWLYQPFHATMAALCAPSLWFLARHLGMARRLALLTAVLASIPALVYSYGYMGAIKEIALLPLVLVLAALLVAHRGWLTGSARGYAPVLVVAAAGIGTIGLAFGAWLGLALAIWLLLVIRQVRRGDLPLGRLVPRVGAVVLIFALLTLPTIVDFGASANLAGSLSQGNEDRVADPGNLLQPIHAVQAVGIWINGTHRVDPVDFLTETYAFIGVALLGIMLGIALLVRRRAWVLGAFVTGTAAIWFVLTLRGAVWTDAKLVVLVSPFVLLLALAGAQALIAAGRRPEGVLLAVALTVGVAWSDAVLYHETNMPPVDRFEEMATIGERFAGQGPTLATDFDEYLLYSGRRLDISAAGFAFKPADLARLTRDRGGTGYGHSYDLDDLPLKAVRARRLLLVRRGPERSQPPSGYERVFAGRYYDVWRRTSAAGAVIAHLGVNGKSRTTGRPRCKSVRRLARDAREAGGRLRYVVRPETVVIDPRKAATTAQFAKYADGVSMAGAGRLDTTVPFERGGQYEFWMRGAFSRPTQSLVDDRVLGTVSYQSGGEGNYATPARVTIEPGRRRIAVRRLGGSWRPGNGNPSRIELIVLQPVGDPRVVDVAPSRWREVCDTTVDWVEAVRD